MPYEITETIPTTAEYTEILTLIHNELVEVSDTLTQLLDVATFANGIICGAIIGCCCSYFIGQILKTR